MGRQGGPPVDEDGIAERERHIRDELRSRMEGTWWGKWRPPEYPTPPPNIETVEQKAKADRYVFLSLICLMAGLCFS